MLDYWMKSISSISNDVLESLKIIVVDDCGNPSVTADSLPENVRDRCDIFRVDEDIPWNQMGARNLGMFHAFGWCIMVDPDMVFADKMIRKILDTVKSMRVGQVVRYGLQHGGKGDIDMSSPNTWIIHKNDFELIKGYDEDYAGHKGWSDVQLLDVVNSTFRVIGRKDIFSEFVGTAKIVDAQVRNLDRSVHHNKQVRLKKRAEAKRCGGWKKWNENRLDSRLRFPWHRVHPI